MRNLIVLFIVSLLVISMLPAFTPEVKAELTSSTVKPVSAWVTTWNPSTIDISVAKIKENIDLFESVSPFSYLFTGKSTLADKETYQEDPELLQSLRDAEVKIVPTIKDVVNPGGYLADPAFKGAYISAIVTKVEEMDYDGVDIDFENMATDDRPSFSSFMGELSTSLHLRGKLLSVVVMTKTVDISGYGPTDATDWVALGEICDKVTIMFYPPVVPINRVQGVLDYAISVIPKDRIVCAVSFDPNSGQISASLLEEYLDIASTKGIRSEIYIWGIWNDSPTLWDVIREKLATNKGWVEEGVTKNIVPNWCAHLDLEEGTDGAVIRSTVQGLRFTTTQGYDWIYCDIRTGRYNGRSLTDPSVNFGDYVVNGYFAAWLGVDAGQGRIDFVLGSASYFSALTSTYSGLCLEAYDSDDNLIATSGWAEGNLYTYTFTRLTIAAQGIAYVVVHDTGNYWEIDDIVTDAPSWGSKISSNNIQKIPQRFQMNLNEGSWTTPDSRMGIDIYDITMRPLELLTELTPQAADNLVANFAVVLKDRNHDGKVSSDEILQNILEQIPEEIAKEYFKFIIEQIYAMNLEPPSPDYGQNLLTQISNFGSTVVSAVETYGPYVIAVVAIPVAISTGFTTYGIGGYQAVTGIYVPTNALLGTTGEITTAMYSHGDFVVTDSEGQVLCKEFSQIPGGTYIEVDLNGDGSPDDIAVLPASTRDYTINIVPDVYVNPDDTFTLTMANLGIYFELVRNLRFSDVPEHGYGLQASMPPTDSIPPTTTLTIGNPNYTDPSGNVYVTSATSFTLSAEDNVGGSGVATTGYRVRNATYDSGWTDSAPPIDFYLTGLSDGEYSMDYCSTDNIGNTEPTNTTTVILDNAPPTTTPTIGEPKHISDKTYVTPDTPFTLEATDMGSGVYFTAHRICNATYDSGWQTYTAPFYLTSLTDGTYTIEYNSTDNVQNTETTQATTVTLFRWNYIYQDTSGRGTTLKINLAHKFFQFIALNKDYGIRNATSMRQCGRAIIINHSDKQLRLITASVDTKIDFCYAMAWDLQTRKCYLLIDKAGIE